MDDFSYLVYIPSLKSKKRFLQLNNRTYKTIAKLIQNNDDNYLAKYLLTIVEDLCVDPINTDELTNLDILCISLAMRSICIGTSMKLVTESNKKNISFKVNLMDVLQQLSDIEYKVITITVDGITILADLPNMLIIKDITDFISTVKINGCKYNIRNVKTSTRRKILDMLPVSVLAKLKSSLEDNLDTQMTVIQKTNNSPKMTIDITSNSVFDFIKLIYTMSLDSFYTSYYILSTKLNFNLQYIEELAPIETEIYLNKYKEENEEIKKAADRAKSKGSEMMMPTPAPPADEGDSVIPGGFKF